MIDTDRGLTKVYNALKDPESRDPRVLDLRALHEEMDRAVLAAYGWRDIPVPPYCPKTDADRRALKGFEDKVIDRLFALNAERADEEQRNVVQVPTRRAANRATGATAKPTRLPGFEDG